MVNFITSTWCKSEDLLRQADTTSALDPCLMMGRICRKSPPNATILPPNGKSLEQRSLNVRSIHSAACLCIIGASSQTKSLAPGISLAKALCLVILHTDSSFNVIGTFSLEWTVLLLSRRRVAIPDEAIASAISPRERILANNVLYKNVLPVPPGSSTKNALFSAIGCL